MVLFSKEGYNFYKLLETNRFTLSKTIRNRSNCRDNICMQIAECTINLYFSLTNLIRNWTEIRKLLTSSSGRTS